ncbi:MAG: hypothetical protein GXY41_11210 [Phycisphaerae bacterium]|nr:hypothetical protein [Phycisphaerae bacterium]
MVCQTDKFLSQMVALSPSDGYYSLMETDALKRYSVLEVVLLAIFALGLALSQVVVKVRSRMVLDEPVELPWAGIAAPLPLGGSWETAGGWRFERSDNAFVLLARLRAPRREMNVRWRYALCDEPTDPEAAMRQRAEAAGGQFLPLGTISGAVEMYFGRIVAPTESGEDFLVGIAPLELGRRLELHITYRGDPDVAENAFRAMTAAVAYEHPELLAAGVERMRRFVDEYIGRPLAENEQTEAAFLIKDAANRPLGYAIHRVFAFEDGDNGGHRRVTRRQFEAAGGIYAESDLWLDGAEGGFTWTTQIWPPRSSQPRRAELRTGAAGRIAVQANAERPRMLQRTPMLLPDIFLSALAGAMAAAEDPEIVIDVLEGSGYVVPVRLSRIDPDTSPVQSEQPMIIIRADYLSGPDTFIDFVFDASARPVGRLEQQPRRSVRLWEATSPQRLQVLFQDRFEPHGRQNTRSDIL